MESSKALVFSNTNEKNVVNCIRWLTRKREDHENYVFTKNDVANILNIQWATAANTIAKLANEKIIQNESDICLNSNIEYYIGISLGTSRVKCVCVDFNFNSVCINEAIKDLLNEFLYGYMPYLDGIGDNSQSNCALYDKIERFELCFNINLSNDSSITKFSLLNDLCKFIIQLKKSKTLNIGCVGFAFPGIVDYDAKMVKNSYIFKNMSDLTLRDLLIDEEVYMEFINTFGSTNNGNNENLIQNYIFDHNSNAACVAEKELGNVARALQGKENLLVIYGGYGYGVGLSLNNKLFRGTKCGGQLGHIQVTTGVKTSENIICRCGKKDCLENRINADIFGEKNEEKEKFIAKPVDDFCEILKNDKGKRNLLSDYLSQSIYTLHQLFGAENIVLTGRLSNYYKEIQQEFKNILFTKYSINPQNVRPSILGEFSAAKGIAIEAYFYKHQMPIEWK